MPVAGNVSKFLSTIRLIPKALRQAPKGTVRRKLIEPSRKLASRAKQNVFARRLEWIDRSRGYEAGNSYFWRQKRHMPKWKDTEARLRHLAEALPEAIQNFVNLSYSTTQDPFVLVNLSRSALSQNAMKICLTSEDLSVGSPIFDRMTRSQVVSAGLLASATLLLPEEVSRKFAKIADATQTNTSRSFLRLLDSWGTRLNSEAADDLRSGLSVSGFKSPKKHRLILTPRVTEPSECAILFQGSEEITVYSTEDLYGKAAFSEELAHCDTKQVNVEHARTRITRFSGDYHQLHEETRKVSETIIAKLSKVGEGTDLVPDRFGAELAFADQLFFSCLQVASIKKLVESSEFDHIVIALGGDETGDIAAANELCRILCSIEGLRDDRRVEVISTASSHAGRAKFEQFVEILLNAAENTRSFQRRRRSIALVEKELQGHASRFAKRQRKWPAAEEPRVLFAPSQVSAYNSSSAAYCSTLAKHFNLRMAFLGGNLLSFGNDLETAIDPSQIATIPQSPETQCRLLEDWFADFLAGCVSDISQPLIANVVRDQCSKLARTGLLSYLAHFQFCTAWFAKLQKAGSLPKLVIVTPYRSVRAAAFVEIARNFNIPSLAVEPHGLNASYCRYSKVRADYYGVISNYFVDAAVDGFGMAKDRCTVIGSPRLSAAKEYDGEAETKAARDKIYRENSVDLHNKKLLLSYLTQPTDWDQISEVWRIILAATESINCSIILKTHPEETASRVNGYMKIAEHFGASERVVNIETDATTAIAASDLVLSGYSATVLEAALLRKPVFCVTNGDVDYPLNQHEVVGGPLIRSSNALRNEILCFLETPDSYEAVPAAFLAREPQFVDGFDRQLVKAVKRITALDPREAIRPIADVPGSLFIDPPHTVFKV